MALQRGINPEQITLPIYVEVSAADTGSDVDVIVLMD